MSRVIKVRIWNKQDKIYYKLYDNAPFNAFVGYKNGDASLVTHEVAFVENDNFIVEQYTGLKDKNGVEIYEGDLVKNWDNRVGKVVFETEIGSCGCCFEEFTGSGFVARPIVEKNENGYYYSCLDLAGNEIEVIGNIHEQC